MARKKAALGRGLDQLLPSVKAAASASEPGKDTLQELPVDQIQPGQYQPRTGMDPARLQELADSITAQGVVQPIVVRPIGPKRYEIIAGERRWRASQLAKLDRIPAVIRDVPDQATMAMALIENIQREDLNAVEQANALRRLVNEFELTHQQVADLVGRSRVGVSNLLRLLDLAPAALKLLEQGDLEMGHARALLGIDGERGQSAAAHEVVEKQLNVRQTEALVRRINAPEPERVSDKVTGDPDIQRLEHDLTERLCAKVKLRHKTSGKGQLVIDYNNADELDGILQRIK